MAKRSTKKKSKFQLTTAGKARYNKHIAAIRKGIENVCEMHKHETNASMSQAEFEKLYIDKLFATPISAISATLVFPNTWRMVGKKENLPRSRKTLRMREWKKQSQTQMQARTAARKTTLLTKRSMTL